MVPNGAYYIVPVTFRSVQMTLKLSFYVIALIATIVVILWATRRQTPKKHPPMAAQGPLMQRSARTQLQATNEAYTIMGPTTIREVEDQVPTVDERGHRHVVIRTRKLETILGSVGPTEIERERRHTLPGQGHVIPLSDTEFEVFHNHAKLHLDIGGGTLPGLQAAFDQRNQCDNGGKNNHKRIQIEYSFTPDPVSCQT